MMYKEKHLKKKLKFFKRATAVFLAAVLLTSVVFSAFPAFLLPVRVQTAENDGGLSEHVIPTISPVHVKFNLFDYWMVTRDTPSSDARPVQGGINQGHSFVFGGESGRGPWNVWTGNSNHYNTYHTDEGLIRYGVYPGIVNNILKDGYPALSLKDDYYDKNQQPGFISQNRLTGTFEESLAYLFDPDVQNDYKAVYENVQGLVKYDGNGGYTYNSHENYAALQETPDGAIGTNGEASDGYFEVYDSWALHGSSSPDGQFFPFDGADEVFQRNSDGSYKTENGHLVANDTIPTVNAKNLNHFMGLTMETVFLQPENGKIDANTPMSFSFSGDDDVWIFIDNVLVSDLGGVHDECFTIIDFEKGMVYTGLTPVEQNGEVFTEAVPTLEQLRSTQDNATGWTWYDRAKGKTISGTYAEFKTAHAIQEKSLRDIFIAAGQEGNQAWGDGIEMNRSTFDQNTQHELKMFYLERGAGASNLVLSFNMLAVPASGVTKTDQDGRPVEGAEFALWPAVLSDTEEDEYGYPAPEIGENGLYIADKKKNGGVAICTATTDENGHLNFVTDKQKIISFQERAQDGEFYYVLEEVSCPAGYRSKGDISLYYSLYGKNSSEGVLLSYNYWQTGAYTQAKLDVTMTETLYKYELENGTPVAKTPLVPPGEDENEYLDNGIIFAVPIKRMDMDGSLYDESNYRAIYGTTNTGWTMMHESIENKKTVLEAAKEMERVIRETRQTGTIIAERNARQLFHVEITNIPGDVKLSYPYLMETGKENESQYNIAFYFAPNAETLEEADAEQIVRIGAATPAGEMFERQYASQFYISNAFNRVRVQKLDYHGDRLAGAVFSLYQTYSVQQREGYVWDNSKGLYRNPAVVNEDGSLKSREEILATKPWDSGTTLSEGSAGAGGLDLDGAIIFPTKFDSYIYGSQIDPYRVDPNDTSTYMEEGEYVIFETTSPSEGYLINETPIAVTVDDEGVFADAGEVNDGVRVGQYAGWVLNSMTQFATEGVVDETLTFLSSTLKVRGENGALRSPLEGDIAWLNKYSNENDRYIFLAEDVGRYVTTGRNLYQFTDEGIPQLQIQQNSDVTARVIILEGEYAAYSGPVTVNKKNADGTLYPLQGIATDGTLGFWLRKEGTSDGAQTLDSVEINDAALTEGTDYHVYSPNVTDLSGYDDLSGLFSIETLVQVYDQSVGNLEVSKATENVASGSDADEELFFYRVYGVYEHATRIVLAETDENGEVKKNEDGTPMLNASFTGTLNVRLRESIPGASAQMTATNVAVDFTNGVGLIYLEPSYEVEHIYIPENAGHKAYGLMGLVETQITLEDSNANGTGTETGKHIAFDTEHTHGITIENGVGILYRNPNFTVEKVALNGVFYYANPAEGEMGLSATSRFNYATIHQVQNLSERDEVTVSFTEADGQASPADRVVTRDKNDNVTVHKEENSTGYCMDYSLGSQGQQYAVVAQFALHAGQTIHIADLAGGTVYYVYEYAAGSGASPEKLIDDWTTEIVITPQDEKGNGISGSTDDYIISEKYPENQVRAARGLIRTNATQRVDFTNSGRVGSLTVSKTVAGDQATDADKEQEFTFTVTLKDAAGKPLKGTYPYTGNTIEGVNAPASGSLTLDSAGSAAVTLKHGQRITIGNIPKDTAYAVTETRPDGFTVVVDNDTDGNGIAEGTIAENETASASFTNIRQSTLAFTKVDAGNLETPLPGAEFKLYKLQCTERDHNHDNDIVTAESNCWKLKDTQTSAEDGKVSFGNLEKDSAYRLVETKAPDGFALPEGQWRITTDENNAITIEAIGAQDGRLPTAFAVEKETGALLLPNARPIDIPSSGGWGAIPYLLGGGTLMLAAAGMFVGKKLYGKRAASK